VVRTFVVDGSVGKVVEVVVDANVVVVVVDDVGNGGSAAVASLITETVTVVESNTGISGGVELGGPLPTW